ncbi:calcium/sodium antiporter [Falsiroseomonas sp. E2-1-a20]|uniref:calcium/sodium antiporter n=1 Tax=Falsiroseomonas sp. E2-1-a20 TaxID=3239300 RepID=UPI003F40DBE8
MPTPLLILLGLVLLVVGGELFVRGAVRIAERFGVSPLMIGLTLVGFGTSMPELVTSVQASLAGAPGIAVGNIVGSNIANILLILGISALIFPIAVPSAALRRDGMLGAAAAAALVAVALVWTLDRWVGAAFLAGLVAYIAYAWRQESVPAPGHTAPDHTAAYEKAQAFEGVHPPGSLHPADPAAPGWRGTPLSVGLVLVGLVLVVAGGGLLVEGATALARSLGVAESIIGLTIVAVGTSMPELVTSVVAALRRHADVALGNVLGSNIYNVLGIGGATGLIAPTAIPADIAGFDVYVMLAVALLLLVFARTGWRIGRREGALLVTCYVGYIAWSWPT